MVKNKGKRKEQAKRYKLKYPERIKAQKERARRRRGILPRTKNPVKNRYLINKALWQAIIITKGMDKCWKCGYNKHFGAIDFHHIEGNKKKQVRMALVLIQKPNVERIRMLEKCIPLCATCHRELHIENGTLGRFADKEREVNTSDTQQERLF